MRLILKYQTTKMNIREVKKQCKMTCKQWDKGDKSLQIIRQKSPISLTYTYEWMYEWLHSLAFTHMNEMYEWYIHTYIWMYEWFFNTVDIDDPDGNLRIHFAHKCIICTKNYCANRTINKIVLNCEIIIHALLSCSRFDFLSML